MQQSKFRTVLRVTSGNFLEMFDFFLFGFYATSISRTFFPAANEFASLMFTFMTFGAGFLMRPLGAVILGAYVDRVGRRRGLITTLAIMACGTILIAFTPAMRRSVSWRRSWCWSDGCYRFSAGVELGSVSVYLSEMASPGHKGFSSLAISQPASCDCRGGGDGYALNVRMAPPNWLRGAGASRFAGCAIVRLIFIVRRSLRRQMNYGAQKSPGHARDFSLDDREPGHRHRQPYASGDDTVSFY